MEFNCIKCVAWVYIQCVGGREWDDQSLHALSLLAAHPGSFIVITSEEREGAGESQKGKAMIWIMKCPVLWMKCVKHFVKSLHDENIKNRKGLLKNPEHFCLIF